MKTRGKWDESATGNDLTFKNSFRQNLRSNPPWYVCKNIEFLSLCSAAEIPWIPMLMRERGWSPAGVPPVNYAHRDSFTTSGAIVSVLALIAEECRSALLNETAQSVPVVPFCIFDRPYKIRFDSPHLEKDVPLVFCFSGASCHHLNEFPCRSSPYVSLHETWH